MNPGESMRAPLAFMLLANLLAFSSAHAQTVYKYIDKHGNLVFSDTPVAGAEAVEVQAPSTIKMAPVTLPVEAPTNVDTSPKYESLVITTPSQDAVFSNEPGPIVITGRSTPRLQPGHQYRFTVNGQTSPTLSKPSYSFEAQQRGSYSATLEIVDSNLHPLLQSAPVTFHVKRHSALFKKPTAPAPISR